jgi:hypothetical protein
LRDGVVGPSLDAALEEYGLRLERTRAPIEFFKVEHRQLKPGVSECHQ